MESHFLGNYNFKDLVKGKNKLDDFGNKSYITANKIQNYKEYTSIDDFMKLYNETPNIKKSTNKDNYLYHKLLYDYNEYKNRVDNIRNGQMRHISR